jgi:hypothetical protein
LMPKKMTSMLLTLLFTCPAFFCPPWNEHAIQTPMYGSCFLPQSFVKSLPGSPLHFFPDSFTSPWNYGYLIFCSQKWFLSWKQRLFLLCHNGINLSM